MKRNYSRMILAVLAIINCLVVFAQPMPKTIAVSYPKTTMLVFPTEIIDADRGSGDISIRVEKKAPTVLKVKAVTKNFNTTNLTVYTEDNKMYSFIVVYDSLASELPYRSDANEGMNVKAVAHEKEHLGPGDVKSLVYTVAAKSPAVHHPRTTNGLVSLSLGNIYISKDLLFLQFVIRNRSMIPYDIHFTRYYIRDNKKGKRTSSMEKEIRPLYTFLSGGERVNEDGGNTMVIAFDKFTVADSKHFSVEVFEKEGDRHLLLNITGKHLLKATPLNY